MLTKSKPISKTDDASKKFIIDCLAGDQTFGFDVDSIYLINSQWYIFEYLKCENEHMTPHTSHPQYYPWNYKKFISLFNLTKKLEGRLFLVNYSDREQDKDLVKLMEVIDIDHKLLSEYLASYPKPKKLDYLILKEENLTRSEFAEKLRELNTRAGQENC